MKKKKPKTKVEVGSIYQVKNPKTKNYVKMKKLGTNRSRIISVKRGGKPFKDIPIKKK